MSTLTEFILKQKLFHRRFDCMEQKSSVRQCPGNVVCLHTKPGPSQQPFHTVNNTNYYKLRSRVVRTSTVWFVSKHKTVVINELRIINARRHIVMTWATHNMYWILDSGCDKATRNIFLFVQEAMIRQLEIYSYLCKRQYHKTGCDKCLTEKTDLGIHV